MDYVKNQVVTVTIEDMSDNGEGIGKVNGYTLFVKDAVIGDVAEVIITKVKKNYGYARLKTLITPSTNRCEPKCRFSRQCGGCQIQPMNYEAQLKFKNNKVKNHLVRIGGFDASIIDGMMEDIVGMDNPWNYRNKAQYPVGYDKKRAIVAGFYAGRTHNIIANTDCALGVEENKEILEIILNHMNKYNVSAYDETSGRGLIRHVLIRKGFKSGEIMVCIIINHSGKMPYIPEQDKLIDELVKIEGMTSISVNINTKNTNVIMGDYTKTIWGSDTIADTICNKNTELSYKISPRSFFQVNPVQMEKLYSLAVEYAGLTGNETVWDMYCGIGTISLFMAIDAGKVYGVEIVPEAIEDAKKNAELNGIDNAEFLVGKAEDIASTLPEPDVIVVDPPRKGCDEKLIETMLKVRPERIVYVSCDSATMARDVKMLCEGGYEIKRIRAVDQFPQTVHVETVCLLSKNP